MVVIEEKASNEDNAAIEYRATYQDSGDESSDHKSDQKTTETYASIDSDENAAASSLSARWTALVRQLHLPINAFLRSTTRLAANHPRWTVSLTTLIAFALLITGLLTNFHVEIDENILFTPTGSQADVDHTWVKEESGFTHDPRYFALQFHAQGATVLRKEHVGRVFAVLDAVRSVDGYDHMCQYTAYKNNEGVDTCKIEGMVNFWNASTTIFEAQAVNDTETIRQLSALQFPDEFPVAEQVFFGFPQRNEVNLLEFANGYSVFIEFPDKAERAFDVEGRAVDAVLRLQEEYQRAGGLQVEVAAHRSFPDEFERAILADIPLVPAVFIIMVAFTCLVFFKKHPVHSRSLLGVSAVVACLLSIAASYGLLFCIGVPFTSITQMLPFIIFGIGLDDAFIIMGAYARTSTHKTAVERVTETIDDVGVSITLTTATSTIAFALGCKSPIPSVYWVCLYAFPAVIMVYLYAITFFVGCIVLDQRRIDANRRDCCTWRVVEEDVEEEVADELAHKADQPETEEFFSDAFMVRFAKILLNPVVKVFVVIGFVALAVCSAISATKLRQDFRFQDVLPSDSYITDFMLARNTYSLRSHIPTAVYFRNIDQSDIEVQKQMFEYIDELVAIDAVSSYPDFFWLRDFNRFVDNFTLHESPFYEQLDIFFSYDLAQEVYGGDVILDDKGRIIESRCLIDIGNVDVSSVLSQIDTLASFRSITESQPINQGKSEQSFLVYSLAFNIWEFYSKAVDELVFAAVTGVTAVTLLSLIMVPHWSAAPIVLPMMCVLYIDILGFMQWGGVTINPVSYVALAMSIGLLVDFIMHVLLKYYELPGTRKEKTVEMLRTMGSSIFLGGVTTFLGTVPLAFSTSEIFYTVFIGFMGLVVIGVSHGLILLPVILSTVGTEEQVTTVVSGREVQRRSTESVSLENNGSDHSR